MSDFCDGQNCIFPLVSLIEYWFFFFRSARKEIYFWFRGEFGVIGKSDKKGSKRVEVEIEARQVMDKLCVLSFFSSHSTYSHVNRDNLASHGIESIYSAFYSFLAHLHIQVLENCITVNTKFNGMPMLISNFHHKCINLHILLQNLKFLQVFFPTLTSTNRCELKMCSF